MTFKPLKLWISCLPTQRDIWCFAPTRGHWDSAHLFGFWCHSEPERVINRALCHYNNPIWDIFIERALSHRWPTWSILLERFVVELLMSPLKKNPAGLSEMTFCQPSGTEWLTGGRSLRWCSNHLHPGLLSITLLLSCCERAAREWEKARCMSATPKATVSLRLTAN